MSDAATNSGLTLHQLTDINSRPTSTTTKQYKAITRLLYDIKLRSASPRTGDPTCDPTHDQTAPNQQTCTIKTLQAAVKNRWGVGGFCSTHGWGVRIHQTSGSCKKKGSGQIDTATRNKPAGPGATKNKGWDDFA